MDEELVLDDEGTDFDEHKPKPNGPAGSEPVTYIQTSECTIKVAKKDKIPGKTMSIYNKQINEVKDEKDPIDEDIARNDPSVKAMQTSPPRDAVDIVASTTEEPVDTNNEDPVTQEDDVSQEEAEVDDDETRREEMPRKETSESTKNSTSSESESEEDRRKRKKKRKSSKKDRHRKPKKKKRTSKDTPERRLSPERYRSPIKQRSPNRRRSPSRQRDETRRGHNSNRSPDPTKRLTEETYKHIKNSIKMDAEKATLSARVREEKRMRELKEYRRRRSEERKESKVRKSVDELAEEYNANKKTEEDLRNRLEERQRRREANKISNERGPRQYKTRSRSNSRSRYPSASPICLQRQRGDDPRGDYYKRSNQQHNRRSGSRDERSRSHEKGHNIEKKYRRPERSNRRSTRSRSKSPENKDKTSNAGKDQRKNPEKPTGYKLDNPTTSKQEKRAKVEPSIKAESATPQSNNNVVKEMGEVEGLTPIKRTNSGNPEYQLEHATGPVEDRGEASLTSTEIRNPTTSQQQCSWNVKCEECDHVLTHKMLLHHHICNLHHCKHDCGAFFLVKDQKEIHEKICGIIPIDTACDDEVTNRLQEHCKTREQWKRMVNAFAEEEESPKTSTTNNARKQGNRSYDEEKPEGQNNERNKGQAAQVGTDSIEVIKEYTTKPKLKVGMLGFHPQRKEHIDADPHDPENKRFAQGEEEDERDLDNRFIPLSQDEKRTVCGLAYLSTRKNMQATFYREIKLGVDGLVKLIGNMHVALKKRDPPTYRHMYIWLQILLKREFDRINERLTPDKLTRTEDIDSTLKLVDKQITQIFDVAERMVVGEIEPSKQYEFASRVNRIIDKTENLREMIEEKASEDPASTPPSETETDSHPQYSPTPGLYSPHN